MALLPLPATCLQAPGPQALLLLLHWRLPYWWLLH